MAKIFTNSSTTLAEANLNKLLAADGTVGSNSAGHASWGLRIRYTGAAWEAVANTGSENQIALVGIAWDTDHLEIDISSCSNVFNASTYPVCVVSQTYGVTTPYVIRAYAYADDMIYVDFTDMAGAAVTVEATSMDFSLILFGEL